MKENIEFARPEDIPQIVAMGYRELKENQIDELGITFSFSKITERITTLVLNHVVFVIRNSTNPKLLEGYIGFLLAPCWFSNTPMMLGQGLYIDKKARSFKLTKELIDSVKQYAILNKVNIVFDLLSKGEADRKRKLMKYLGFDDWGSSFVYISNKEV